jgi:two-component SAPR family response regulator
LRPREEQTLERSPSTRRTAVLVDTDVAWFEELESVPSPFEVDVKATVRPSRSALEVVESVRPDLLLVGVSESNSSDMAAFVRAAGSYVGAATIAFGRPDENVVRSMLNAGAAYVLKPPA